MTQPHVIRLRGVWEFETLDDAPERGSVQAAGDWLATLPAGVERVRFRRRFHRPTGLSERTVVTIVLSGLACERITLNDEPLDDGTDGDAMRVDVSSRLRGANLLTIDVDCRQRETMTGQVWLEISER